MAHSPKFQNNQSKLLCCLNSQRLEGQFCDVRLKIGKLEFCVHSCVLAAYNPSILENHNINDCSFVDPLKLSLTFNMKNEDLGGTYCAECATKVMEFMYMGNIQIQRDHFKHIEAIGKFLGLSDLLSSCKEFSNKRVPGECGANDFFEINDLRATTDATEIDSNVDDDEFHFQAISSTELVLCQDQTPFTANTEFSTSGCREESAAFNSTGGSSQAEELLSRPNPQYYACSKCENKFTDALHLRRHRETHLSKLYSCYTCKYSSQKAFQLIRHLLDANHNEKVCSLCMYESESPDKLKGHLEQHNHTKPFFCTTCKIRFPTRAGLNIHLPKHSSDTPFYCSTCHRGFKWKHNLQSHLVIHTTEKKHLCELCGFSTAHKSTFSAHELSHTGYNFKCPIVGCKFVSTLKRSIGAHLATHNKEKPYQCEICGQSFSQAKNLRRHAIKHDASADFDFCPLCSFKTIRYDKLKEHYRKRHPESDLTLLPLKKNNVKDTIIKQIDGLACSAPRENVNVQIISSFCLEDTFILPLEKD